MKWVVCGVFAAAAVILVVLIACMPPPPPESCNSPASKIAAAFKSGC